MINQSRNRQRWSKYTLGILQLFIGIGAVYGGIALIIDPSGSQFGLSVNLLRNAPFPTYLIPGLVLLIVNGIGSMIGGVATLRQNRYAGYMAMVLGAFLVLWIVAQIWWIGFSYWLQPLYFIFGLIESALGIEQWQQVRHPKQQDVIL